MNRDRYGRFPFTEEITALDSIDMSKNSVLSIIKEVGGSTVKCLLYLIIKKEEYIVEDGIIRLDDKFKMDYKSFADIKHESTYNTIIKDFIKYGIIKETIIRKYYWLNPNII